MPDSVKRIGVKRRRPPRRPKHTNDAFSDKTMTHIYAIACGDKSGIPLLLGRAAEKPLPAVTKDRCRRE
jgi:hypothetical protein